MQSNEETSGNPNLFPIIQHEDVYVVDSRLIAEALGIEHKNFLETLKKYQEKIEEGFGTLAFQTREFQTKQGNKSIERFALLTEDQAIFLATLSRNTKQVVEFKAKLVLSFAQVRQVLSQAEDLTSELAKRLAVYDKDFENIEALCKVFLKTNDMLIASDYKYEKQIEALTNEQKLQKQALVKANQQIAELQNSQSKNKMVISDTVVRVDKIEEVLEVNASHWAYVMCCPNRKIYKFGASNDVKERKKNFKTVAPNMEVYRKIPAKTSAEAFAIEKMLKTHFAHRHLQNEWYALTEDDLHYFDELELTHRTHFTQVA